MTADRSTSTIERQSRHGDHSTNSQLNLLSIMNGVSPSDMGTTGSGSAEQHLPQVSLTTGSSEAAGSSPAAASNEQNSLSTAAMPGTTGATDTSNTAAGRTQIELQLLSLETQVLGLQVQVLGDELNLMENGGTQNTAGSLGGDASVTPASTNTTTNGEQTMSNPPSSGAALDNSTAPASTAVNGEQAVTQPAATGSVETTQAANSAATNTNEGTGAITVGDGSTTQPANATSTNDATTTTTTVADGTTTTPTTPTVGDGTATTTTTPTTAASATQTSTAQTSTGTSTAAGTATSTPGTVVADGGVVNPPASEGAVTPGTWQNESINGMNYEVLLPANYDPANKYPVVLYEHQLDMGTDLPDLENEVNPWFNTTEFRTDHPSIVVMPLLDQTADPSGETVNFGGVSPGDQAGQDNAIAALQQVESQYSTDPSRIYMTGNSLGGIGTWDTMLKYNAYDGTQGQIFDAGMPLAGNDYAISSDQAAQELAAGNVPMWSYHGADDTQVPNGFDEAVAADLTSDPNYHYTEVANTGHDVWDSVYTDPSTWNWLFAQQGPTTTSSAAAATA